MTIGDVLAFVGGAVAICLSNWALLILVALVFRRRAQQAQGELEQRPVHALGTGAVLAVTAGAGALFLVNQPNGLLKLFGWALLLGLLALSALGGSGLVLLIGSRIRDLAPQLSELGALGRGAGLLLGACLVVLLGWFVVVPLTIIVSLGTGCRVLRRPRVAPAALSPRTAPEPLLLPTGTLDTEATS